MRTSRTTDGEVDLAYDEDGNVIRSTQKDASGSVFGEATIDYNQLGDPQFTTVAAGPLSSATNYRWETGWDTNHRFKGQHVIDTSGGQQEIGGAEYDHAGRLVSMQSLDVGEYTSFGYDNTGNITSTYTRHGICCATDANPYAEYTYTHDQNGRITSQTLTGSGLTSATRNYTYDTAARLESESLPSGLVRTFHYDDDSNRTSIDELPSGGSLATIATYTYSTTAQDRLSSISGSSTTNYTYTADGETASYGTSSLTWNGHDKIATDDPTSTAHVAYTYDPLGRLQERATTGPTADNEYIYVGNSDTPIMITDGAGTITESYVFGPLGVRRINHGPPLVSGAANGNYDLNFFDGSGNTAGTINASGTRTNTYTYNAFGAPDQSTPSNTLTNRFLGKNGRPLDTQTGLILMGARPYDAVIGRFLSGDPVERGSANLYDYADQNPVGEEDPDGTSTIGQPSPTMTIYTPRGAIYTGGSYTTSPSAYTGGSYTTSPRGPRRLDTPITGTAITRVINTGSKSNRTTLYSGRGRKTKTGLAIAGSFIAATGGSPSDSSADKGAGAAQAPGKFVRQSGEERARNRRALVGPKGDTVIVSW
jgi:RHS repeat-associated protein